MNKLKATFVRQYRKGGNGRMVFVYAITGPADQVKAYEEAQGDNLINDDKTGAPLMFTITPGPGKVNDVIQTGGVAGRPIQFRIDTSEMDRTAALVDAYGGAGTFGKALAQQAVAGLNLNFNVSAPAAIIAGGGDGGLNAEAGAGAQ